ncbi:hypothetical protein [Pseudobutyrivibrio ruminis]|uniref:hypothetical protein n=1 Tax=Pseudobutyrivibrio ruminis TaxID=46206 RepID=UPI000413A0E7|nr:hypothetical protein [Pseudobutyrivibrio ruminis]
MRKIVKNPLFVLAAGCLVVLGSSIGATRAAFVYKSAAEEVDFHTSNVKVALLEGTKESDVKDVSDEAVLSFPGIPEEDVKIGQEYPEVVSVKNTSNQYKEYIRVTVKKFWVKTDEDGQLEKDTSLDPSLIKLDIDKTNGKWFEDTTAETAEEEVYYLPSPVECQEVVPLIKGVTISNKVVTAVETKNATDNDGNAISGTIEDTYIYDGGSFYVDVKVDAVQSHNGAKAMCGAWGVDAKCDAEDDGNIISINGVSASN